MNGLVFVKENKVVTDSLMVAEVFGKEHKNVMRDIEKQIWKLEEGKQQKFNKLNFERIFYKDSMNRDREKFLLSEDAFTLIAMSYTTVEAMIMKVKFIQEFKRIKEELMSLTPKLPQTFSEALRLAADLQDEIERNKPKIEKHDRFLSGENLQKVGDVAKVLKVGRNKLFELLRTKKILMSDNVPYQKYIDRGYFEVKETPVSMGGQTINKPQTFVTAKGIDYIDNLLNKTA